MRMSSYLDPGGMSRHHLPEPGPMEESILDAVERVIARRGVTGTTLEAMAAEAGFSKGGLLHYFPNKQAILFRLIDRMEQRLAAARRRALGDNPDPNGHPKATIRSFLDMIGTDRYGMHNIAELLADPGIRAHVAALRARMFQAMSAGSHRPERIALAMMLAEGFWLDSYMEESAFPLDVRTRTMHEIDQFLDQLEEDFSQEQAHVTTAERA